MQCLGKFCAIRLAFQNTAFDIGRIAESDILPKYSDYFAHCAQKFLEAE